VTTRQRLIKTDVFQQSKDRELLRLALKLREICV